MTLLSSVFGGLAILYEVVPKLQGFFTGVGCWTEHPINYAVPLFRKLKRRALWNIYKGTLYHRKPALYEISGISEICEHLWEACTSACKVQEKFQQCVRRLLIAQKVCRKPQSPEDLSQAIYKSVSLYFLPIPSGERLSNTAIKMFSCRRIEMEILRCVRAA